jgi:hypothetical protein
MWKEDFERFLRRGGRSPTLTKGGVQGRRQDAGTPQDHRVRDLTPPSQPGVAPVWETFIAVLALCQSI